MVAVVMTTEKLRELIALAEGRSHDGSWVADANLSDRLFIAAADPTTVKALCEELLAAQAEIEWFRAEHRRQLDKREAGLRERDAEIGRLVALLNLIGV